MTNKYLEKRVVNMTNKYLEKIAGKPISLASALNVGEGLGGKLNKMRNNAKFEHYFSTKGETLLQKARRGPSDQLGSVSQGLLSKANPTTISRLGVDTKDAEVMRAHVKMLKKFHKDYNL